VDPATLKELAEYTGKAWTVIGPLIGVFVGSWLTTKGQHKHWLLDNKRAEYRKLLTTLSACGSYFVTLFGMEPVVLSPGEQRKLAKMADRSPNVIYNRLFIAGEMKRLNIMNRWVLMVTTFRNDRNVNAYTQSFDAIVEDIRTAALKDFS